MEYELVEAEDLEEAEMMAYESACQVFNDTTRFTVAGIMYNGKCIESVAEDMYTITQEQNIDYEVIPFHPRKLTELDVDVSGWWGVGTFERIKGI